MELKRNNTNHDVNDAERSSPPLGVLMWVKIHDGLWWPAQVVDDKMVCDSNKLNDRIEGGFLVRLYGSYDHLWVDPMIDRSEFEDIVKQNNYSEKETFRKVLELDIAETKAGDKSKRKPAQSKGKDYTKEKKPKKCMVEQDQKETKAASETRSLECSNDSGTRRVKMMRCLGLTAPPGSPFQNSRS
ncbi:hypothetical protein AMTRI_Chr04g250240 [Amborella trichopoda]